jgi:RNA polymerase sigma factor (sigma-70 family)
MACRMAPDTLPRMLPVLEAPEPALSWRSSQAPQMPLDAPREASGRAERGDHATALDGSIPAAVDARFVAPGAAVDADEDARLIARLAAGDKDALALLFDRYAAIAFGIALRVTHDHAAAEDVVQEAFLGAWRGAAGYVPGRASARTWLLSIVHHRSIDAVRRRRIASPLPEDEHLVSPALVTGDVSGEVLSSLEAGAVRAAVGTLPPPQRLAIELAYFGGLTQTEIARMTGTPLGTVKGRMRLGLEGLRRVLPR